MNNNPNYIQCSKNGGNATKEKWDAIKYEYINGNPSKCIYCEEILPYQKRNNKFCSRNCSVRVSNKTRKITNIHRERTSNTIIEKGKVVYLKNPILCKICNAEIPYENRKRKTCSDMCYTENLKIVGRYAGVIGGRVSAKIQSETRRSKNEILFSELCKEHFNVVLTNESIFNGWDADVIIEDIKVAVLWNGKWHYEKITEKHSVKQVQNRDKIKIDEIKKCGYIPYVIKDMGKFDTDKVQMEFDLLLKVFGI
jgi:hypothetical protein